MKPCSFDILTFQEGIEPIIDKIKSTLIEHNFIYSKEKPELLISLGGDGTFLSSMMKSDYSSHYLSINLGHLGFFSDYSSDEIDEAISDIINKEMIVEEDNLFEVISDNQTHYFFADVVLNSIKTVDILLYLNDKHIVTSKANGIVISSSLGSTGYNLSLNSPICFFTKPLLIYSLIAPVKNKMNQNVIAKGVVSADDVLDVVVTGDTYFSLDGQPIECSTPLKLKIKLSSKTAKLCHFKEVSALTRIKKNI